MSTPFEVFSRLVTVRDISQPILGRFDIALSVEELNHLWVEKSDERGEDPMNQIALATDKGHVIGWLSFDSLWAEKSVGECTDPIDHNTILAAGTPIIDAVRAFATTSQLFFFVLENNSLTGVLFYGDLYKLPFRLCLLSMLLGIEQLASDLCKTQPVASLGALNSRRLGKAKETYRDRRYRYDDNGKEYEADLLDCTMFIDKVTILQEVFEQTVPASTDRLFKFAEKFRNDLAHPREEGFLAGKLKRDKLLPLIDWAEKIQRQMEQTLKPR
jgi:hypothetical protein